MLTNRIQCGVALTFTGFSALSECASLPHVTGSAAASALSDGSIRNADNSRHRLRWYQQTVSRSCKSYPALCIQCGKYVALQFKGKIAITGAEPPCPVGCIYRSEDLLLRFLTDLFNCGTAHAVNGKRKSHVSDGILTYQLISF